MGDGARAKAESPSRRRGTVACVAALVVSLSLFAAAPSSARQTHLFQETFGSAAKPEIGGVAGTGLTLDPATGDLLVLDENSGTIARFKPNGEPDPFSALGTNVIDGKAGSKGKPCFEEPASCDQTPEGGLFFGVFPGEQEVAVDSSGTVTDGDIYVTQAKPGVNLIDVFSASGEYLGQLTGAGGSSFASESKFGPCGVAVDGTGNLFVAGEYSNKIYKFDPSVNPPVNGDLVSTYSGTAPVCSLAAGAGPTAGVLFALNFFSFDESDLLKLSGANLSFQGVVSNLESRAISVDPVNGHLYSYEGNLNVNNSVVNRRLSEYDALGTPGTLISTSAPEAEFNNPYASLVAGNGRIYMANPGFKEVSVFGPLVTVPDVSTGGVTEIEKTAVTLNGTVKFTPPASPP